MSICKVKNEGSKSHHLSSFAISICCLDTLFLPLLAGIPTAISYSGIVEATIAFAPITAPLPITAPDNIMAWDDKVTLFPILMVDFAWHLYVSLLFFFSIFLNNGKELRVIFTILSLEC